MKHKTSAILMTGLGAVLLSAALLLLINNGKEDTAAGEAASEAVSVLRSRIEAGAADSAQANTQPTVTEAPAPTHSTEENIITVQGYDYIGYVSIPALELELPVMSMCDYGRLVYTPCRQSGSAVYDDLVIVAHNFDTHFGRLKELEPGDRVTFTDADGIINSYTVELTDTLAPDAVEAVLYSGYDLVLYTCTYGGRSRVTVFCNRDN